MSYDPSYTYQNQSQEYFSEEQYYYYYAQDYVNTENTSFEKNDTNSDLTLAYPYEEYNFAHPSDTYNVHNISQHSNSVSVRHPNVSRATSYDSFEYSQGLRTTDSRAGSPQSQAKCRQLPCRTFISTGSCPYGDRCVFLHDPTIEAKPALLKHKVNLCKSVLPA